MLSSLIPLLLLQAASAPVDDASTDVIAPLTLEVVEVRAAALQNTRAAISGITTLDAERISRDAPTHANELFDAVPGAWISRGSGQEQLTAIRSPVLSGPGACGAFMVMEDRVPIRPTGFCNVNELFEVNLLQAQSVDVIRGPGSVIYGSNALHGVVDVSSADPAPRGGLEAGLEAGTDDFWRGRAALSSETLALRANYTDAGSFRIDEGYRQAYVNGVWLTTAGNADVRTQLSWSDLDQDTAGFVQGKDAYRDPVLRVSNQNPEAFREASALRITSRWSWALGDTAIFEAIPYVRSSDMDFLQHFLPGKPLEENGQDSAGLLLSWSPSEALSMGLDLEWADGYLVQFQENPTEGSIFLQETRPVGFHYDYDVRSLMAAAWAQYRHEINDQHAITAGLRLEQLEYRYRNNMLDGNTRDDGSVCGFGGCLYTRPADRDDSFTNLAPELGYSWQATDNTKVFTRIARGFRAPQATELYRLQNGQSVADLNTETLDTLELGLRQQLEDITWDATAFAMRKEDSIFRDADGFNVSDGRTDHIGLEASVTWQLNDAWRLASNASWARHTYAYDRPESGVVDGNKVDTAPEWLAAARLNWQPLEQASVELEWVYLDAYWLDPANEHRYPGHDLLHLRAFYALPGSAHSFAIRINNILDDYYAERADFAFGNYRYFPGAGRRFSLEWRYTSF